jgi:hypothetical protein
MYLRDYILNYLLGIGFDWSVDHQLSDAEDFLSSREWLITAIAVRFSSESGTGPESLSPLKLESGWLKVSSIPLSTFLGSGRSKTLAIPIAEALDLGLLARRLDGDPTMPHIDTDIGAVL